MTTADHYHYIGKSHMVCQDASASWIGKDGRGHAVVCDGCSSVQDSEFGAALLVRATRPSVARQPPPGGLRVAERAQWMAASCCTPVSCLDATLMMVHEDQDTIDVEVWGDGVVMAKFRDGGWMVGSIEFAKGAPTYPSYSLSEERLKVYLAETDLALRTIRWYRTSGGEWVVDPPVDRTGYSAFRQTYYKSEVELVAVASDGLSSFQRRVGGAFEAVPLLDVLGQVLAFKNFQGEFVKRRMRRFLTHEAPLLGWHHDDDVSLAAVHVDPHPLQVQS